MSIKLLFFAQCAEWMQKKEMNLNLAAPQTLLDVMKCVSALTPLIARKTYLKVAVNQVFADYETEVHDGDEVAFFPPFSGG